MLYNGCRIMYEARIMANDLQNVELKKLSTVKKNQTALLKPEIKHQQIEKVVRDWALKCAEMDIKSNVELSPEQINLLKKIHILAINFAISQPEAQRDPRKISYIANDELRTGLTAIILTRALTDGLSKAKYTKEYIYKNTAVFVEENGTVKNIVFNDIEHSIVQDAIFEEIVYDWIIYRQPEGRKINALSDEKTHYQGLNNFKRGFSPISEFSRFERKLFEDRQKKLLNQKEETRQAFRNSFVQQIAIATAQQLMATGNPLQMAQQLFASEDYTKEIENILSNQKFNLPLDIQTPTNTLQLEDLSKSAEKLPLSRTEDEMSLDVILSDIKSMQNDRNR